MAIVKAVEIEVNIDGGDSIKELKTVEEKLIDVEKGLRNVSKASAESAAEKNFKAVNKIVDESALSVQDMTKAMENYVNIAATAGRKSPIGQEALQRAASLKDEIDGLSTEVQQLAKDGQNLQAALQLGGTVVAGYQGFQSTIALLGVENEALLETMVKLEAANGLLLSVEQIRMSLEKESVLVQKAQAFWSSAQTKALSIQSKAKKKDIAVTGLVTAAQWLWNAAVLANPIVAMIVGITALIGGLILLANAFGDSNDEMDKSAVKAQQLNDINEKAKESYEGTVSVINSYVKVAQNATASDEERAGAVSALEKELGVANGTLGDSNGLTEEAIGLIDQHIEGLKLFAKEKAAQELLQEKSKELIEAENSSLAENKSWWDLSLEAITGRVTTVDKLVANREESIASIQMETDALAENTSAITNQTDAKRESNKELEKGIKEAEEREKAIEDQAKKAKDAREKRSKERRKRERLEAAERLSDTIAAQKMVDDLRLDMMAEGEEKAVSQRQSQFDDRISKIEKDGQLTKELEKLLAKKAEEDIAKIREDAAEERSKVEKDILQKQSAIRIEVMKDGADKEIAANKAMFELRLEQLEMEGVLTSELEAQLTEDNERKLEEIRDKWRKIGTAKDDEEFQKRLDSATKNLDTMSQGVETFGELNSAFAEAQLNRAGDDEKKREAIERKAFEREKKINIARALIGGAQAAVQAIAKFGPPPSPLGIAGIVSAGVITAAQIAAISSAKFQGSGSASVPTVGGVSVPGGGPDQGNADSVNETAPFLGGGEPGEPKLVVSAVDMSNVQNSTRKIEVIRTLD